MELDIGRARAKSRQHLTGISASTFCFRRRRRTDDPCLIRPQRSQRVNEGQVRLGECAMFGILLRERHGLESLESLVEHGGSATEIAPLEAPRVQDRVVRRSRRDVELSAAFAEQELVDGVLETQERKAHEMGPLVLLAHSRD